ncbi:MAG: VWA domain-containing protein [Firmicutes bacterium]|nr:VWA domain-containing protein [Bacillota bacterium]
MTYFDFTYPLGLLFLLLLIPVVLWYKKSIADMPEFRKKAVFVLRILIIILLCFAISGFRLKLPRQELMVLFVVDASLSVSPDNLDWAKKYMEENLARMPAGDSAGVIIFGKDAYLEENPGRSAQLNRFSTIIDNQHTNISNAIQLATAVFPESSIKKIVLITDGNENMGEAEKQAILASNRNVEIHCLAYPKSKIRETLISNFEAPPTISRGEPFTVRAEVESTVNTKGILNIYRNGKLLARENVDIAEGKNLYVVSQNVDVPGNYQYSAILETNDDKYPQNNKSETITKVEGYPRILYLTSDSKQNSSIPSILAEHKFVVDTGDLRSLPSGLPEMATYQTVIFDNVNGLSMSADQMQMIENYVRDLGGGFIMIGGDKSFGAGGYYNSPVERILPVDLDIRKKKNLPSIAMVLCIDKSGSMGDESGGVEKLRLAREAAIATAQLLGENDFLGVVDFDDHAKWVVPIQYMTNKDKVVGLIASIRVGGGTSMYPALNAAYQELKGTKAMVKHIIALTDGRSAPADFENLVKKMAKDGITVSAVGVGEDSDTQFLENIAKWGQGRFYYTDVASYLPRIFVRESILAGRSALIEETFKPSQTGNADFLKGINVSGMPNLHGYVATVPKDGAQLIFQTHQKDPLMASWRIGLGKSVAFTSDDGYRWAKDWVSWDQYGSFWSQTVRWCLPAFKSEQYSVNLKTEGSQGKLTVEAMTKDGNLLNFLQLQARVISPGGETSDVTLRQTASGRYEADFETKGTGTYFVNILEGSGENKQTGKIQAFSIPYSPEFKKFGTNDYLLEKISTITGGKRISSTDNIFEKSGKVAYYPRPAWLELLIIALMLFPLDVALRRVYLPENAFAKVKAFLAGSHKTSVKEDVQSVTALKKVKTELREKYSSPSFQNIKKIKDNKAERQTGHEQMFDSKPAEKTRFIPERPVAGPALEKMEKSPEPKAETERNDTIGRLKKVKKDINK